MILPSLLAATLPTLFLVWLIWWGDRYEREPTRLLIAAFLWGALPAVLLALLAELAVGLPFNGGSLGDSLVQTAMIAPVVEEIVKGLALLGLIRFARPEIDGILDGIVYGALVGAGFAMTENFLYFMSASGADAWALTVIFRAFVFGLNHIFYTAIFGAAIGLTAGMRNNAPRRIIMVAGLMLAMSVHAFHNFAVTLTQTFPPLLLATVLMNWGGALVMALIVLASLQRERNSIRAYLDSPEAASLTPEDRRRLLATLPPRQRFIPNFFWLPPARQRDNRLYQYVAELSLRRQRLPGSPEMDRLRLTREIAGLQAKIESIAIARQKDEDRDHRPA